MFRYKLKCKKVGVLPIWIVKSNVSSVDPSSEREAFLSDEVSRNVRLYYPYRQYTNLFIFQYFDNHVTTASFISFIT